MTDDDPMRARALRGREIPRRVTERSLLTLKVLYEGLRMFYYKCEKHSKMMRQKQ